MTLAQAQALSLAAKVRDDFPILHQEVNGQPLVYFDNAATSQKPKQVLNVIKHYYELDNANVHRGVHALSARSTDAYEGARDKIAAFVNAASRDEIVFTRNASEAINLVAYAWGMNTLQAGDEIILSVMEHHSNLVPWQFVAQRTGAVLKYVGLTDTQELNLEELRSHLSDKTKLITVNHVSNTLGCINPIEDIVALANRYGARVLVDACQSTPHMPLDVQALGCDWLVASGHKMCGPTGIGVLYGKEHLLEEMQPYLYGGMMIRKVTFEDSTWHDLPWKFEAGTPVIEQGIALAAAIDYLEDIGMERIQRHEEALAEYAHERLTEEDDVTVLGPPADDRAGVVSFNVDGVHAHDLSSILNDYAVAIRAGDHCTQPLHDKLGIAASARASFYIYNTKEEVDRLVEAVDGARELFAT